MVWGWFGDGLGWFWGGFGMVLDDFEWFGMVVGLFWAVFFQTSSAVVSGDIASGGASQPF